MKKATLLLVLATLLHACVPALAQTRKDYKLESDYGVWAMTSKLFVKNLTPDTVAAKAKFPRLAARFAALKFPISKLMNMNVLPAAWNDAVLQGQSGDIAGIITSRNGIEAADGDYDANYPCIVSMGDYIGQGTGYTNPGAPTTSGRNMNTCIRFTGRANWIGTEFDQMNLIQSSTWGVMSGSTSYIESGTLRGFRLEGDNAGWYDPSYTANGIAMWDMGETWTVSNIFSTNHNGYGAVNVRGTPATWNTISLFTNALGGIGLIGTELNSIWLTGISGDDNPALVVMDQGYGRGAGGNVVFTGVKSESGKRTPNKGQIIIWQRSPCVGNITVLSPQSDMNGNFTDASFVMQSRAWGQTLNVLGYVGWNLRTMVHDVTNRKRWAVSSYSPQSFVWCSRNGGALSDLVTLSQVSGTAVNATDRLGMVANNGTFDYVAGTPAYSITGGATPPPACSATWMPGATTCTTCSSGLQTCTTGWVSSSTQCQPTTTKPADVVNVQACTTTPPSTGIIATLTATTVPSASNANQNASHLVNWKGVRRYRFTNLTMTLDPAFQRIGYLTATDDGIKIDASGRWKVNGVYCTQIPATWARGVNYPTAEIVLPSNMDVAYFLTNRSNGTAFQFTATKIEVLDR